MPGKPRMLNGWLNFSRIKEPVDVPYLLETQKTSYEEFLQLNISPDDRMTKGLQEAFMSIFPIQAAGNPSSLEFIEYNLGTPKYSVRECIERGMTYAAPLKVKLQLIVREINPETSEVEIIDIKEQETYMGEIPLMTDKGTFIINGAERVIVSQLHRSPGVSFSSSLHPSNKTIYSARLIPDRGAWVEFEVDINNIMHVMIDRKRKLFATTFLRAFGFEYDEEIASEFFETETLHLDDFSKGSTKVGELEEYLGELFIEDITDPKSKEKIVSQGDKITKKAIESLKSHKFKSAFISQAKHYEDRLGRIMAEDVIDKKTGEVLGECWERITTTFLMKCARAKVPLVKVLLVDSEESDVILSTISKDKTKTRDDALVEFFKRMRPGNPVSVTSGRRLFEDMFFSDKRYDLGPVGRYKIIRKFGGEEKEHGRLLERSDIINLMKYLIRLQRGEEEIDDIDHLGNRRVRSVGELLQNQIRIGLADMEKTARERMSIIPELENLLPQNLVNAKPVLVAVKDFFGRSQLSQFMDQTNPLAELTNKRRLSALGPGGLSRDRAGFEVRDVHYSHYGRICPIETPEGPNIGLISSLSTYACVNKYGFIESPYRKVKKGKVTEEIEFLTADVEDNHIIAQANAPLDDNSRFELDQVFCRYKEDFPLVSPLEVEYMDVSPKQLVSVSASLIPFLEHDDANRALMGSNMQRQAVPLLTTEKPLVGTGIEKRVAVDSGVCILARHDGVVERVESREIWIKKSDGKRDVYILEKFIRSNQNTCLNQKPLVNEGDRVAKGDVIADGPAINDGHIALGKNILVAFMPWGGYNFEDAILISEKLVKNDTFTSIHIEEFEVDARDTKLGKEEITRDIPNVSEEALSKLDEDGLVHIGADVVAGDILVGKVSPKGETELSSEEKLLRAIFGEKAGDVRDASLRVPSGVEGTVIDIKVFSRKERGSRTDREDKTRIEEIEKTREKKINTLEEEFNENLRNILKQHLKKNVINFETGEVELRANGRITEIGMEYINRCLRTGMLPVDGKCGTLVKELYQNKVSRENKINDEAKNKTDRVKTGDELPPGVIKLVKVYVATKRKVSVGDKMAGRHGNKGVIAKILPEEDMPFLEDGTSIDIILNPLGVPSRMNIGQILETCAGWAAKILGVYLATPVFDGMQESQIREFLKKAHLPISGQVTLYDGHTGEPFDSPVTVGYIYMMKLVHLVDDKMHARAIGPYSLVTQQPLGGKAQFGGQRFGEMEVWALEAYGSAFTLQEMLTVKSDDVTGRTRMYESIVKGRNLLSPGIPESFNVLVKELQGLGLNMELLTQDAIKEEEQGDEATLEKEEELLFENLESEKSLFSDE